MLRTLISFELVCRCIGEERTVGAAHSSFEGLTVGIRGANVLTEVCARRSLLRQGVEGTLGDGNGSRVWAARSRNFGRAALDVDVDYTKGDD